MQNYSQSMRQGLSSSRSGNTNSHRYHGIQEEGNENHNQLNNNKNNNHNSTQEFKSQQHIFNQGQPESRQHTMMQQDSLEESRDTHTREQQNSKIIKHSGQAQNLGEQDCYSNIISSNMNSARAISFPISGPMSDERDFPGKYAPSPHYNQSLKQNMSQNSQVQAQQINDSFNQNLPQTQQPAAQQPPGPSPLVRQLSDKVRSQAERLQAMENYKNLCERRIVELDPGHSLPVMPYHLGQPPSGATGSGGSSQLQGEQTHASMSNTAELKKLLAVKEQDLYYTKRETDRLQKELDQLKQAQGGQPPRPGSATNSNFEALRKEIEINEKLQKEMEMLKQNNIQLRKVLSGKDDEISQIKKQLSNSNPLSGATTAHGNPGDVNQLYSLREQVAKLDSEKNALLDYIEENIESTQQATKLIDLQDQNSKLEEELQTLRTQIDKQKQQPYVSPNFADGQEGLKRDENEDAQSEDLPASIHSQAEDTFGNAEAMKRHFAQTQSRLMKEKEQLEKIIKSTQEELKQAKEQIEVLKSKDNTAGGAGNLSHRSHISSVSGDNGHQAEYYKQKCRDLEGKNKYAHENSRTLSQTLNETQQELETLVNDHQQLLKDTDLQLKQIEQLNELNESNQKLIENLREEKDKAQAEAEDNRSEIQRIKQIMTEKEMSLELQVSQNQQLTKHIAELKAQGSQRTENMTREWTNTVQELKEALRHAQDQVSEREKMFQDVEQEYREKIQQAENQSQNRDQLQTKLQSQQKEISLLSQQVKEKDAKLKMQITKNQELLGELQELSEAVHALKTDKAFSHSADLLEEKVQQVSDFTDFIQKSLKNGLQLILREFQKCQEESLISKQKEPFGDQAWTLAQSVSEACQNAQASLYTLQSISPEDCSKLLECAGKSIQQIESVADYHQQFCTALLQRVEEMNKEISDVKNQLDQETSKTGNLEQQIQRIKLDETQQYMRDQSISQELQQTQMALIQKEQILKETYKREEKNAKTTQRLKNQVEALMKEQTKLVLKIKDQANEQINQDKAKGDLVEQSNKVKEREKQLEFKINSTQQQLKILNEMIQKLKNAMPSNDLRNLVESMQEVTKQKFELTEAYSQKENELLLNENELRLLAKSDSGLSQKVINLRKDIQLGRQELKQMAMQKIKFQDQHTRILEDLKSCEHVEKRRYDVALETEQALVEAKQEINEYKKQIAFVNNNRRDLETALHGQQEENQMISRELSVLRDQLGPRGSQSTSLGDALSKMRPQSQRQPASAHQPPLYPKLYTGNVTGLPPPASRKPIEGYEARGNATWNPNHQSYDHLHHHNPAPLIPSGYGQNPGVISIQNQQNTNSYQTQSHDVLGISGVRQRSMSLGSGLPPSNLPAPYPNNEWPSQIHNNQPTAYNSFSERENMIPTMSAGMPTMITDTRNISMNFAKQSNYDREEQPPNNNYSQSKPIYNNLNQSMSDRGSRVHNEPDTGNWRNNIERNENRQGTPQYMNKQYEGSYNKVLASASREYGTFGQTIEHSSKDERKQNGSDIRVSPSVHQINYGQYREIQRGADMPLQYNTRYNNRSVEQSYGSREDGPSNMRQIDHPSFRDSGYLSHQGPERGNPSGSQIFQNQQQSTPYSNQASHQQMSSHQEPKQRSDEEYRSMGQNAGEFEIDNQQDQHTNSRLESETSMLLRSEVQDGNQGREGSGPARAPSALQQKLHQVKNVFTAIRENLHEGSSEATLQM